LSSQNSGHNYDVFFYEAFKEEEDALRRLLPRKIKAGFIWKTIQEEGLTAPPAALISIRTQSQLKPEWTAQLKGILSRSTGYEHLLCYRNETRTNAALGYLPLYCHRAVAEQAMLVWMALMRKFQRQTAQFAQFNRDGLSGWECEHKTLVVVGVGNVGYQIVKIGRGLGMHVWGVDLVHKHPDVDYLPIEEAIERADVIVCAMNLTPRNVGYFDYQLLSRARRGLFFVNIARGEMSPISDMLRLMNEQRLGGLALDVFENETELAHALRSSQDSQHPAVLAVLKLKQMSNVILTPHNAFNSLESVERKAEQSIRQVQSFLDTGNFLWIIPDE